MQKISISPFGVYGILNILGVVSICFLKKSDEVQLSEMDSIKSNTLQKDIIFNKSS